MANLRLYGTPISVYVRVARLLLEEAGIEYDLKDIGIFNGDNFSADYLAKNPFGKVPTLEMDGVTLYETSVITDYLDTILANNRFSPSDALTRARMRQIIAIIDSYLYDPAIHAIAIQRLIVPSQGGQADEDVVNNAIPPTKTAIEAIESLTIGSPYLLGEDITLADFHLIPVFIYLSSTPEFKVVTAQTPKLQAWWELVSNLPTVKKVCG